MKFSTVFAILSTTIVGALAESHKVHFVNRCGTGTPTVVQNGKILAKGDYTSNGPLLGAVAYLQTGKCALNGSGCVVTELALSNPTSFADVTAINTSTFDKAMSFKFDKCSAGASCTSAGCIAFSHVNPPQTVQCTGNDAGVTITYC